VTRPREQSAALVRAIEAAGGVLVDFAGNAYGYEGREITNGRGLVACHRNTWAMAGETISRIATETGILPG
jgi:hypothetical protein